MSRVAKQPVKVPSGVEVAFEGRLMRVKGPKGTLEQQIHELVEVAQDDGELTFSPTKPDAMPLAGTMRALANNMVKGVSEGFERKLELVGVGYRAQMQGNTLNLTLGFSHPVNYPIPEGITVETPTQTEIVVKGASKQVVGHVAANIRAYRPPEPYKGKGVKYADETIIRKEAKKK